jgi:hypothetical protein
MSRAFVLGNGVSRRGIDLDRLKTHGKIYGCNALYRDFVPDVLVATDRPISTTIQESGYALTHEFYTRRPTQESGAKPVLAKYHGYSSGPNAIALAADHRHTHVYLLGFDMGPVGNNSFNNVYADTEFYKSSSQTPTFTGNWVKQILKICQDYAHTQFVRVCGPTTAHVADLENVSNLQHLSLQDFVNQLDLQQ